MKTRFSLRAIIATMTCIAILLAAFVWSLRGVTVTVFNEGDSPLIAVKVHVTGKSYDLGDIAGGAIKKCTVSPVGESHIEISYNLTDGTTYRHSVDCYFESGYRATVDVDIREKELIQSSAQIRLSFL